MELELSGVVRYTHYALMVYGYNRIPIVDWMKKNADESLVHAARAGEMVTLLGGHPSLAIGPLLETHRHDIGLAWNMKPWPARLTTVCCDLPKENMSCLRNTPAN
jgi:bacterioferritin